MPPIFTDWSDKHTRLFGRHTAKLSHSLHESELFTDEALADLIDRYPETHYHLQSMGSPEDPRMTWRRGVIADCPGADVIAGIRAGRLWLNLRRVHEVDPRYAKLLDAMFAEMELRVPGLKTYRHNLGILVSSPRAQVYYHADIPGQALWQIRGRKRIWIYPNTEPFLREEDMESAVLGLTEEDITYEKWYDDHAEVYDLEPGQMLHWALNGPHRVVNHDCLNVSVTTEHWTDDIRKSYAVRYANAVMRHRFGVAGARQTSGPGLYAKALLTLLHRKFFRKPIKALATSYDFKLDRNALSDLTNPAYSVAAE